MNESERAPEQRTRLWPNRLLLGPAPVIFLAVVGTIGIAFHSGHAAGTIPKAGIWAASALAVGTLAFRSSYPSVVLAVVLVIFAIANFSPMAPIILLALATFAALRSRREAVYAGIATALVLELTPAIHGHPLTLSGDIVSRIVGTGLAVALGLYLRARQDYIAGLHDRADRAERERELLARQAVADERVRIARELHDAVAHNVSLMVVQAQALQAGGADAEADPALHRIAGLGREALSEMHRMLGVLRLESSGAAERTPQPGVDDLDALIDQVRETGLDAALHVEGTPRPLAPGLALSAYRIVQEALTNVIRHAQAQSARVTVSYASEALELRIVDDGVGPSAVSNGDGGHGLVGMRERVAVFGGALQTGAGPAGRGYQVRASLPLS